MTRINFIWTLMPKSERETRNYVYIQRRQTLINAVRPPARDESAVFLLYLPTVYHFLQRLFALTKHLRPSLYLPVAPTTSNRVLTKVVCVQCLLHTKSRILVMSSAIHSMPRGSISATHWKTTSCTRLFSLSINLKLEMINHKVVLLSYVMSKR